MIHCQISRDFQRINSTPSLLRVIPFFAESAYTGRPRLEVPDVREVYGFLKHIFEVGKFSPECCVISLIYMNRLIGVTGVPLTVDNWKPSPFSLTCPELRFYCCSRAPVPLRSAGAHAGSLSPYPLLRAFASCLSQSPSVPL